MMYGYMRMALEKAREAGQKGEIPVGAVIILNGTAVSSRGNECEQRLDPTAHAEMLAIRDACEKLGKKSLDGCELYVTLEPCPMCAGAMVMSRLGRIVYGASDPDKGCCGSVYDLPADPAFAADTRWTGGEQEEACRSLLDRFFHTHRRK